MGTFAGHALPGSFFLVFAVWWTTQIFHRYFKSLRKNGKRFESSVTFPFSCLCRPCRNWEMEGILKIFFCSVGLVGEVYTGFRYGRFVIYGNAQHASMFFIFGLTGLVDILLHVGVPLPRGLEYIASALAFSVEFILFRYHLHGRTEMNVHVHILLLYVVGLCIISTLLEMKFRKSVLAALSRVYLTFLQGTWFWQVGFILYNPLPGAEPWHENNDPEQMMIITMIFSWHMIGVFVAMLIIGGIIGFCHRIHAGKFNYSDCSDLEMNLIKKNANGHIIVDLNDSESDIEFERPVSMSGP